MARSAVRFFCAAVAVAVALPTAATAEDAGIGVLRAVGGDRPVPTGAPITVSADTYDDLNVQIQEVLEGALAKHGYTVSASAPLVLTFDFQQGRRSGPAPRFELQKLPRAESEVLGTAPPGMAFGKQHDAGESLRVPDVVIAYDFAGGTAPRTPTTYNLDITVGYGGAPPIWQGSMTAALPTPEPLEAARAMVPPLVGHLGRTAAERRVVLKGQ